VEEERREELLKRVEELVRKAAEKAERLKLS